MPSRVINALTLTALIIWHCLFTFSVAIVGSGLVVQELTANGTKS